MIQMHVCDEIDCNMTSITLASLIRQFETTDLAMRLSIAIKRTMIRALCTEYTKGMSNRIRRVVLDSTILALSRHGLLEYAESARLAMISQ